MKRPFADLYAVMNHPSVKELPLPVQTLRFSVHFPQDSLSLSHPN